MLRKTHLCQFAATLHVANMFSTMVFCNGNEKREKKEFDKEVGIPAIRAAESGQLEQLLQIVEQYPAIVNSNVWFGVTPLVTTASNGHLTVVEFLLNNGANVDQPQERI